jgi:hypothetical protein
MLKPEGLSSLASEGDLDLMHATMERSKHYFWPEHARIFWISFVCDRSISLEADALHPLSFLSYGFRLIRQIIP